MPVISMTEWSKGPVSEERVASWADAGLFAIKYAGSGVYGLAFILLLWTTTEDALDELFLWVRPGSVL